MTRVTQREESNRPYTFFILALSIFAIIMLAATTLLRLDPASLSILHYADHAICVVFLADFVYSLYRAPNRLSYFLRWGWLDLLSSLPMVDTLRLGRTGRISRIFRLLRGVRSSKVLTSFILQRRTESAFMCAALLFALLVVISSVAILQFETSAQANIKTPEDAIWWSLFTIMTVGYGDCHPISTEGRVIACVLMFAGVGLFGILSGFVATWFLRPTQQQQESEFAMVLEEVRQIRKAVEAGGIPINPPNTSHKQD